MKHLILIILGTSVFAHASGSNLCPNFYVQRMDSKTVVSEMKMAPIGPIAAELKNILTFNEAEVQRAFERLSAEDKETVKKNVRDTQALVKKITEAKIPIQNAAEQVKKLIKYNFLFSVNQTEAFKDAFAEMFGRLDIDRGYSSSKEGRLKLKSFEKLLSSESPEAIEKIDTLVSRMESILRRRFTAVTVETKFDVNLNKDEVRKEWAAMDPMQKSEVANRFSSILSIKPNAPGLISAVEEIQTFLNTPGSRYFLKAILKKTLPDQIKIVEKSATTWKTGAILATGALANASLAFLVTKYGFSEHIGLVAVPGALYTIFSGLGSVGLIASPKPILAKVLANRKFRREGLKKEGSIVAEIANDKTMDIIETKIRADELREEVDDFSFSAIMKELENGLPKHDMFKVPLWGKEFQKGFSNVALRQSKLDERLDLIAKELDPLMKELHEGKADLKRLSAFQVLVEVSEVQVQNLLLDIAFLRNDYMALGLVLDKYIAIVQSLKESGSIDSTHTGFVQDKIDRLTRAKERLFMTAQKTNGTLDQVRSVVGTLNDYDEIIISDIALSLKDRRQ